MSQKAPRHPDRPKGRSVLLARPKGADRLKKRSDFLRVKDAGKKWVSPTVIVQVGTGETPGIRYGITATKKTGNAVTRNRIKRRLREAVRAAIKTIDKSADIVLIGREATATCSYAELVRDLRWCFKRLEIGA